MIGWKLHKGQPWDSGMGMVVRYQYHKGISIHAA